MAQEKIRFYLDENVPVVIAEQLKRRSIEAITVLELGALGEDDPTHLERAVSMGCVLCTHDTDFILMAQQGREHTGIVFGSFENTVLGIGLRAWNYFTQFTLQKICSILWNICLTWWTKANPKFSNRDFAQTRVS